jgi:transglutaminase-like putative cysteine protease
MRIAQDVESRYLQSGDFVNSDNAEVMAFTHETIDGIHGDVERILKLFYRIRDEVIYDPYVPMGKRSSYTASDCLKERRGWCVPKVALLVATARVSGIPARCGYADVRNHLATQKLLEATGSDIFCWHSYADLFLEGRWVKATPAFNKSMCEKFGLKPLDFDGYNDSLFHEYDQSGNRHMEYLNDRGTYFDVPFDEIVATFREQYNGFGGRMSEGIAGNFQSEIGAD